MDDFLMSEDSFEKIKKGAKETGKGVEDASEAALDTAEGVKDTAEGVIEGIKDTVEGVKEGVEGTADVFEDTAKEVTDADTYKSSDEERKNREFNEARGKEPKNPEDIASHEPTAVKRDKKQGTSGDPV